MSYHALVGPRRRYRFIIHGKTSFNPLARRRRIERRQPAGSRHRSTQLSLASIAHHENLLNTFRRLRATGGQAHGVDGISYHDVSISEIAAVLRIVAQAILDHSYRPYPTRLVPIPKGDGRYRELRIATIVDRVVAAALTALFTLPRSPKRNPKASWRIENMSRTTTDLIQCLRAASYGDRSAQFKLLAAGFCPFCERRSIRLAAVETLGSTLEIVCTHCHRRLAQSPGSRDELAASYNTPNDLGMIPQAMLLDYADLKQSHSRKRMLRHLIVDEVAFGASVEPGLLRIELRWFESQRPTWADIEQILGLGAVAALRRGIRPRASQHLCLMPGELGFSNIGPAGEQPHDV